MVDHNMEILNRNDLQHSFFQTIRDDPTQGFNFDASAIAGHAYPSEYVCDLPDDAVDDLTLRLRLGSHLALYLRHQLELQKGYTSTVGIATSKLLSKLAGNLNKPKGQTTIMPPVAAPDDYQGHVAAFMDDHEIGRVPGIGFKLAQKLREFFLQRPARFDAGLVYGGTKERVTVSQLREHPDVTPGMIEELLAGPGSPHGIGHKIWYLLNGIDDAEVHQARAVPSQISIEDSYIRLDTISDVLKELTSLAKKLLSRMRIDLLGDEDGEPDENGIDEDPEQRRDRDEAIVTAERKWLAHPKTLRLTTRPRQPLQPDGTRVRSFKRISHSGPLPNFVFNLRENVEVLTEKLIKEHLIHMFRKLHPEKAGWNLSLVNLAVTNMVETAGTSKTANGRDIGSMFRRQEDVLKDFRITEVDPLPAAESTNDTMTSGSEGEGFTQQHREVESNWDAQRTNDTSSFGDGDDDDSLKERCGTCGLYVPSFAMVAHRRFHLQAAADLA